MSTMYLSSRRVPPLPLAGRIADRLAGHLESDVVISAADAPEGSDVRRWVAAAMRRCKVVIVLIDSNWLEQVNGGISDSRDTGGSVSASEVAEALRRRIPILPLLLDDAHMPNENELPSQLARFAKVNALPVESGRRFDDDVRRVLRALDHMLGRESERFLNDDKVSEQAGHQRIEPDLTPAGDALAALTHQPTPSTSTASTSEGPLHVSGNADQSHANFDTSPVRTDPTTSLALATKTQEVHIDPQRAQRAMNILILEALTSTVILGFFTFGNVQVSSVRWWPAMLVVVICGITYWAFLGLREWLLIGCLLCVVPWLFLGWWLGTTLGSNFTSSTTAIHNSSVGGAAVAGLFGLALNFSLFIRARHRPDSSLVQSTSPSSDSHQTD